ncbi:ABC transporter ATP-binding protein [Vibrio sp. SS-MA-C1-2]|uniref:ABC transporter ATP-binding protein n=1 Tax=Vibrio sp. SS-MA-C1-2 TaxID=2908646 RepID=UPI001F3EB930|nr:ABC transporter ATP-binding protein [Vibrio sp. SS-MA-C1-2]UJF18792.1 ABC transporter ATP-binding protein [Vibrio sp. SS-MA-C1-2]
MSTLPIIKATNVTKTVTSGNEKLTILNNLSLEVMTGETVALVGVSGAGKSTLMSLLAGLDIPTSGDIDLVEQRISNLDDEQRAAIRAQSLGFVFQSFLLIPSLTALENVLLPSTLRGEKEDKRRAQELLAEVGLTGREHHLPSQLSGGEQQRVALARAFMMRPNILFADEPTGNLDQQTAEKIISLLFALNRDHGTTLVLVTHDNQLAARCHRIFTLSQGNVTVAEGNAI